MLVLPDLPNPDCATNHEVQVTAIDSFFCEWRPFFMLIVATSVFHSWRYRSNGSVLTALALPTASNSWPFLIPVLRSGPDQRPYLFVDGMVTAAAAWQLVRRHSTPSLRGVSI